MTDNQRDGSKGASGDEGRADEQMATDESGFGGGAAAVPDDEGADAAGAKAQTGDEGKAGGTDG